MHSGTLDVTVLADTRRLRVVVFKCAARRANLAIFFDDVVFMQQVCFAMLVAFVSVVCYYVFTVM